jgi:hypothetical protein
MPHPDRDAETVRYEYFLSRDVSLDVRVKISLLDLSNHTQLSWLRAEADSLSEMTVTANIYQEGLPMHTVPIGTHTHGRETQDDNTAKVYWGEWVSAPLHACVCLSLLTHGVPSPPILHRPAAFVCV